MQPTLEQLQDQLADIQAQLAVLLDMLEKARKQETVQIAVNANQNEP